MNQSNNIRRSIIVLINYGITNKSLIYTKVVDELKVPRPTVRRVARDLIIDLEHKVKVLRGEIKDVRL